MIVKIHKYSKKINDNPVTVKAEYEKLMHLLRYALAGMEADLKEMKPNNDVMSEALKRDIREVSKLINWGEDNMVSGTTGYRYTGVTGEIEVNL
jgi:hypothetical protein